MVVEVESFLSALWGRKDEERGLIEIFSGVHKDGRLIDRKARHLKTVEGAAEAVEKLREARPIREIYVCVSLAGKPLGKDNRVSVEESIGVAGLFADVDFVGAGHAGKAYPPDEAAARRVLEATGLRPTILVHSGGGLQAWWLGEEVVYFDSPEEKVKWIRLARGWVDTLAGHARSMGWVIDPAKDLARLLRVAGTMNGKGPEPRPVRILEEGPRYGDWGAFEERIAWRPEEAVGESVMVDGLILDPRAEPRSDLFFVLGENDRKFKRSWKHERPDLLDQSASAYDMSLASCAVRAGWPDQEIVNLLIAHRRRHGEDLKLREDYYRRTIQRARASLLGDGAIMRLDLGLNSGGEATGEETAGAFVAISKQLGLTGEIEIARVVKLLGDPPAYRIYTAGGATIDLGGVRGILEQGKFQATVADLTGVIPETFKPRAWRVIAQEILSRLEVMDVGDEGHPLYQISSFLEEFLEECPASASDWEAAAREHMPFQKDGLLFISARGLTRFMNGQQSERYTERRVAQALRLLGWRSDKINLGAETTRRVWGRQVHLVA